MHCHNVHGMLERRKLKILKINTLLSVGYNSTNAKIAKNSGHRQNVHSKEEERREKKNNKQNERQEERVRNTHTTAKGLLHSRHTLLIT